MIHYRLIFLKGLECFFHGYPQLLDSLPYFYHYLHKRKSNYWKFSIIFKFKTLFQVHYDEVGLHPQVEKKDDI